MKRLIFISLLVFLLVVLFLSSFYLLGKSEYTRLNSKLQNYKKADISEDSAEISSVLSNLYKKRYGDVLKYAQIFNINKDIDIDEDYTFSFESDKSGKFNVVVSFRYLSQTSANASLEIEFNRKQRYQVILDNFVYYDFSEKQYDRYGNEIVPEQYAVNGTIYSFFKDGRRISSEPIVLDLKVGKNELKIKNLRKAIRIESIAFVPIQEIKTLVSYSDYKNEKLKLEDKDASDFILVEAEDVFAKNDFLAGISNIQSAQVSPYEVLKRKINIVDENAFKTPGQELFWIVHIDKPGIYKIGFRYQQSTRQGIPVFRNLYIDGTLPFKEFNNLPFEYTSYAWKDKVLPYEVYLDKGYHVLSLEVSTGIYENLIEELQSIVRRVQSIGLDIQKLVGNNLDPNRTWDIEKYMPGVLKELRDISLKLRKKYTSLLGVVGQQGRSSISDLIVAADLIDKILKKPEKLPFFLDELSGGASSVAQRLSELSMRLKEQPMGIDKIYIFQGNLPSTLQSVNTGFITMYEEVEKLWLSLFNKNQDYSVFEKTDVHALRIWVNRPVQYVETLQYLIDTDFTKKTGIPVILSLMPNEQKLILAASSGNVPDIALSISNWIPFELAIRKALYPLSDFPDFFEVVSKDYNIETLLPMVIEDKVYGVTETQNFYVLFYRKDIISNLDIPLPNTWDDVKKILPELQRRGMNFFIPMCEQTTKYFNTTAPFFFQNDAKLYSRDGLKAALNEENSVKAFELMTDLFSVYGMPEQVANFYNSFRYGRIPIGVGDFGLYVVLSNAADELYGVWDIALSPGVVSAEGVVKRYQVSGDRADVVFANSDKKEKAWIFLKWWLSKETQVKFARTLVNRYGPTYLWNTANVNAFKELDFIDERHKKVILNQWKWIREVQRHPGGYMTEREVSNIWNRVVVEGYPLRTSIDRSVIIVNRELERKLTEFGYIKEGKPVKPYKMYANMEEFVKENLGARASVVLDNQRKLWGDTYGN